MLVCLFLESRNSQISRLEVSSECQKDDKRVSLQAFPAAGKVAWLHSYSNWDA